MSESYRCNSKPSRSADKKVVAEFARGHFDGNFMPSRNGANFGASRDELQFQIRRGFFNETFVAVALRPAQPVIEMGHNNSPFMPRGQLVKHAQQRHRVHSAGHGNHDALAPTQESSQPNGLLDGSAQIFHPLMLLPLADEASEVAGNFCLRRRHRRRTCTPISRVHWEVRRQ